MGQEGMGQSGGHWMGAGGDRPGVRGTCPAVGLTPFLPTGAPCLSFDVVPDPLGQELGCFPLSLQLCAGTQAESAQANRSAPGGGCGAETQPPTLLLPREGETPVCSPRPLPREPRFSALPQVGHCGAPPGALAARPGAPRLPGHCGGVSGCPG